MQLIGMILASYALVCFKTTRVVGLGGFALLLLFFPALFVFLAVTTAAIAAFIYLKKGSLL